FALAYFYKPGAPNGYRFRYLQTDGTLVGTPLFAASEIPDSIGMAANGRGKTLITYTVPDTVPGSSRIRGRFLSNLIAGEPCTTTAECAGTRCLGFCCAGACAPGPGQVAACAGGTGACNLACLPGFTDCTAAAGCETNTGSDPNHCGGCSTVCSNLHRPTP